VSRNRVALVIANSEYVSLTQLSKAENDGEGMSSELTLRGFTVTALANATAIQMERAIQDFVEAVKPSCDSFFHFSGHGLEQDGRSYLLPVDYTRPTGKEKGNKSALDLEAHRVSKLNSAGCSDTMNIIMLDCCREDEDNSIYRNAFGSSGTRSSSGDECFRTAAGHCAADSSQFLLAFGSAPGTVSLEFGKDDFGVFTGKFLEVLKESHGGGEDFHEIFRQVTIKVSDATKGLMEPWYNAGGLKRRFYFGEQVRGVIHMPCHILCTHLR
jgi:uncharacterized caspase-like protein